MSLTLGEQKDQCLWIRKSQTQSESPIILNKLHKLGMTSKMHEGKIFLMMTLRFLQKGEFITQDHIDIYNALDPKHFKEGTMPASTEEEESPFTQWVAPDLTMYLPGAENKDPQSRSSNSGTNTNKNPDPVPEPDPEPSSSDSEPDGDLFDLFAD